MYAPAKVVPTSAFWRFLREVPRDMKDSAAVRASVCFSGVTCIAAVIRSFLFVPV